MDCEFSDLVYDELCLEVSLVGEKADVAFDDLVWSTLTCIIHYDWFRLRMRNCGFSL